MEERGVEWIILITDNYKESITFYKDILDFRVEREIPEEEFCQFTLKNCFLAIYGRTQIEKLVGNQYMKHAGGAIYTFPQSKDIDKEFQGLKQKGVIFIKEPTTQAWGQRTAYFTDPDGHIWEIQQWITK